jgi:hypothetical protein
MPDPAEPRSVHSWSKRAIATILTLGAVAGAIGAMLGLRSSIMDLRPVPEPPDPRDVARISIETDSPVGLSEGQALIKAMQSQGAGSGSRQERPVLVRRLQPDPTSQADSQADPTGDMAPPEPEPEPSSPSSDTAPEPAPSSSDDTTASTSESTSSTPSTNGQPTPPDLRTGSLMVIDPPAGSRQVEVNQQYVRVMRYLRQRDPSPAWDDCSQDLSTCPALPAMRSMAYGPDGKPVPPEVAAERILEVFRDTRTSSEESGPSEALGVFVTADLELIGLRGREVKLSWLMYGGGKGRNKRLHGNWLNANLAYSLKPQSEDDTSTVAIWVPLPRSAGPFRVHVLLKVDGVLVAHKKSKKFS